MPTEIIVYILAVCIAALAVSNIVWGVRILKIEHELYDDDEVMRHRKDN